MFTENNNVIEDDDNSFDKIRRIISAAQFSVSAFKYIGDSIEKGKIDDDDIRSVSPEAMDLEWAGDENGGTIKTEELIRRHNEEMNIPIDEILKINQADIEWFEKYILEKNLEALTDEDARALSIMIAIPVNALQALRLWKTKHETTMYILSCNKNQRNDT